MVFRDSDEREFSFWENENTIGMARQDSIFDNKHLTAPGPNTDFSPHITYEQNDTKVHFNDDGWW